MITAEEFFKKLGYMKISDNLGFDIKNAMIEYAKEAIKADRINLVNHVYALIKDHDSYTREYVNSDYSVDIDMSEDSPLQYGCTVIVDKDSILSAPNITLL